MSDRDFAIRVKNILKQCIKDLGKIKWLYLEKPEIDFSRTRKISFESFISICLQMEGDTLQKELLKYFDYDDDTPTSSALCQRRAAVSPEALHFLYCCFTEAIMELDAPKTYRGYRLIACDGSDINIPYNPSDYESYQKNGDKKGFNQLHINVFHDVLNGIYIDCIVEPDSEIDERSALISMLKRYKSNIPAIIMADMGYESYNVLAHLSRSGQKFLVRIKPSNSNGILSSYELPEGEFDLDIHTILTRRQARQFKEDRDTYTVLSTTQRLDFIDEENPFFELNFRVLCIKLEDGHYEFIATNLPRGEFTAEDIKELYHMRWTVEGSFRELKYTIDLVTFHCRKRNFVMQEIWARLIVFNFCQAIIHHISLTRQTGNTKNRIYAYKVNAATAISICKEFLKRGDGDINPCRLIGRFLTPVRPGRSEPRNLKAQSAKSFLYRAA